MKTNHIVKLKGRCQLKLHTLKIYICIYTYRIIFKGFSVLNEKPSMRILIKWRWLEV